MPECRVKEMTVSEGGDVVVGFQDGAVLVVRGGQVDVFCPPALEGEKFQEFEAYADAAKTHLERESFPWKEEVQWNGRKLRL